MKRVMLDVPDTTNTLCITYIYQDEKTFALMIGSAYITQADDPSVMNGKEAYIVNQPDRSVDDE